jgi:uridylate kinase
METICISLGGSIIARKNGVNVPYARKFIQLLKDYQNVYKFIVAVGGGSLARLFISSSKQIITNNAVLDEIGIATTRINAMIVKDMLSDLDVYPNVVTNLDELKAATKSNKIVVLGGLIPGVTTDTAAILACEVTNSKVAINVSRDGYIYNGPPNKKGAKKLEEITHNDLIKIATERDTREAGSNFVFDLQAAKLAKRSGIEIRFVNDDINQLRLAMINRKHAGSVVKD